MLEIQQRFLERFKNYRADTLKTLDDLGLEFAHFLSWRENTEFDLAYRKTVQQITQQLRQESFLNAHRRVHDGLIHGVRTETYTNSWRTATDKDGIPILNDDGEELKILSTKRVSKISAPPVEYLKIALTENSIARAITELANEGVLPEPIARRIIQRTDSITKELMNCFEVDETSNLLTEQKAIALIKAAVLNNENEKIN